MKKNRKAVVLGLGCLMALFLVLGTQPAPANAGTILADTAGADNYTTSNFYGVRNLTAGLFIQSVTFNITADADGFFDFDGAGNFGGLTAPAIGTLVGLVAGDISFIPSNFVGGDNAHPAVLTINFAPGSFGPGDSMRFSADTDFFISDPTPGGVFGQGGAIFSAVLESGQFGSTPFIEIISDASVAPLSFCEPIPVPPALWLFGSGLVGLIGLRRYRRT
jgi:hypothetical protein